MTKRKHSLCRVWWMYTHHPSTHKGEAGGLSPGSAPLPHLKSKQTGCCWSPGASQAEICFRTADSDPHPRPEQGLSGRKLPHSVPASAKWNRPCGGGAPRGRCKNCASSQPIGSSSSLPLGSQGWRQEDEWWPLKEAAALTS